MNSENQSLSQNTTLQERLEEMQQLHNGIHCWNAREIMVLLGYSKWKKFLSVIEKAKAVCKNSGTNESQHFLPDKYSKREGFFLETECENFFLTRLALYLILANADGRKPYIAKAQTHFLAETYRMQQMEMLRHKKKEVEADKIRVEYRKDLSNTEKVFSKTIKSKLGKNAKYGVLRSVGDEVFFGGKSTAAMEKTWGVKKGKLADYLPTAVLAGKNFATQLTIGSLKKTVVFGESDAKLRHKASNRKVRSMLLEAGMVPERAKVEDVSVVRRRLKKNEEEISKLVSNNTSSKLVTVVSEDVAFKKIPLSRRKCQEAFSSNPCSEATLWELAILMMAQNDHRSISTEELEEKIPQFYKIPVEGKQVSPIKNEPKYVQRIRNLKSNKGNKTSPIKKGFVMVVGKGFQLSALGVQEAMRLHAYYFS